MSTLFVGPVSYIAPHEWSAGDQGPYGPTPGDLRRTYGTVRRVFYCCFREGLRTPASPRLAKLPVDNCASILRRVAGRFLALISMSAVLGTVLAMIVGAVVRDWIARDKALREAAADTPGMRQAVVTRGDRAADHQQWIHGVELWLRPRLPGRKTRKTEGPALKAIEPPKVEDPTA